MLCYLDFQKLKEDLENLFSSFFYHFCCNITKYDCAKFHVKSIFLSGFTQGGHYMPPTPNMIRQKHLEADTVKQLKVILKRCIAFI